MIVRYSQVYRVLSPLSSAFGIYSLVLVASIPKEVFMMPLVLLLVVISQYLYLQWLSSGQHCMLHTEAFNFIKTHDWSTELYLLGGYLIISHWWSSYFISAQL